MWALGGIKSPSGAAQVIKAAVNPLSYPASSNRGFIIEPMQERVAKLLPAIDPNAPEATTARFETMNDALMIFVNQVINYGYYAIMIFRI